MLSFEYHEDPKTHDLDPLLVYLDAEGLRALLQQLQWLVRGTSDHLDLLVKEWGGDELQDSPIGPQNKRFGWVKIVMLPIKDKS